MDVKTFDHVDLGLFHNSATLLDISYIFLLRSDNLFSFID